MTIATSILVTLLGASITASAAASPAAAAAPAASGLPNVRYAVSIETQAWQPLDLKDVERILDAAAAAPLSSAGSMTLVRSSFADIGEGDYTLLVRGRFIEEAEDFTVYITFGAGKRQDLPSIHVAETAAIGKRPGGEMQRIIEDLTRRTASRLAALLAPHLARVQASGPVLPLGAEALPWTWPAVEVPAILSPSALVRRLVLPATPDLDRAGSVGPIGSHAFDDPGALAALEHCVLRDPSADVRIHCARALAPVSRQNVAVQRLILYAMRNEFDDGVLPVLVGISQNFVGLSRSEAIETWLELISSPATPDQGAEAMAEVLAKEGDVPNLDFAVARCLQQETLLWGKKHACAQWLLPVIPRPRRDAVVWRFLENVSAWEGSDAMVLDEVLDHLWRHTEPPAGAMCEVLGGIAARSSAGRFRGKVLQPVRYCADPSPRLVEQLLKAAESLDTWLALRPLVDIAHDHVELRPQVKAGLEKLAAKIDQDGCTPPPHAPDARKEVQDALSRLK